MPLFVESSSSGSSASDSSSSEEEEASGSSARRGRAEAAGGRSSSGEDDTSDSSDDETSSGGAKQASSSSEEETVKFQGESTDDEDSSEDEREAAKAKKKRHAAIKRRAAAPAPLPAARSQGGGSLMSSSLDAGTAHKIARVAPRRASLATFSRSASAPGMSKPSRKDARKAAAAKKKGGGKVEQSDTRIQTQSFPDHVLRQMAAEAAGDVSRPPPPPAAPAQAEGEDSTATTILAASESGSAAAAAPRPAANTKSMVEIANGVWVPEVTSDGNGSGKAMGTSKGKKATGGGSGAATSRPSFAAALEAQGQQTFKVWQSHLRKAPKQVWLAVGDNGLTVFAGESVLETLHYAKMKSWSPGFQGDTLTLLFVLGHKPKKIEFPNPHAERIVKAMDTRTRAVDEAGQRAAVASVRDARRIKKEVAAVVSEMQESKDALQDTPARKSAKPGAPAKQSGEKPAAFQFMSATQLARAGERQKREKAAAEAKEAAEAEAAAAAESQPTLLMMHDGSVYEAPGAAKKLPPKEPKPRRSGRPPEPAPDPGEDEDEDEADEDEEGAGVGLEPMLATAQKVKTAEDAAGRLALVKAEAAKRLAVELEATKAKDAAAVEEAVRAEMDRQRAASEASSDAKERARVLAEEVEAEAVRRLALEAAKQQQAEATKRQVAAAEAEALERQAAADASAAAAAAAAAASAVAAAASAAARAVEEERLFQKGAAARAEEAEAARVEAARKATERERMKVEKRERIAEAERTAAKSTAAAPLKHVSSEDVPTPVANPVMGSSPELEIVIKMEQWYEVQLSKMDTDAGFAAKMVAKHESTEAFAIWLRSAVDTKISAARAKHAQKRIAAADARVKAAAAAAVDWGDE